jgi:hypothetical protein
MNLIKNLLSNLIIFFFPFLFTFFSNVIQYDLIFYFPSFILFLFLYLILFFFLHFFFKIKYLRILKFENFLFSSLMFFNLSFFLDNIISSYNYIFQSIFFLSIFIFIYYCSVKFILLKKFIFFFVIFFLIIFSIFNFLSYKHSFINKSKFENDIKFNFKNFKQLPNIYLIVTDEMASPSYLRKYYDIEVNDYFNNDNIKIFSAFSNYNGSYESLSNFFYEDNLKSYNSNEYYPFKSGIREPNFLKWLIELGYDIQSLGSLYSSCIKIYSINCIKKNASYYPFDHIIKNSPFTLLFEVIFYDQIVYLKKSILNIFFTNFGTDGLIIPFEENLEIEIEYLNKYIKRNNSESNFKKNNVFIVHNNSPHHPYRTEECKVISLEIIMLNRVRYERYKSSVVCTLNKINKLINTINEFDNQSLVFVFGDHGHQSYMLDKENSFDNDKYYDRLKDIMVISYNGAKCTNQNLSIKNINDITKLIRACLKYF